MGEPYSFQRATGVMRKWTGIVIPVYFPEGVDSDRGEGLLADTVAVFCEQVADPSAICLSVDGEPFGADVVDRMARAFGVSVSIGPVNRGKLQAVSNGVRSLPGRMDLKYVAVVDQDGDHFPNELLNFVRTAEHIAAHRGADRALVLGRRISRHRPMGFLRGELEELADRVLMDALAYHAAITGRPLCLEYANVLDEFPDFHSGYKLFSAPIAREVFLGKPRLAGVSETCYYRHACEAVMVVEALAHGAYLGVVNRSTLNEQPITTFGLYNRIQLVADKIIWPCKRLEIPSPFVEQWLANHIPRLLLGTLLPDGKAELEDIRKLVMAAFTEGQGGEDGVILHPLFV